MIKATFNYVYGAPHAIEPIPMSKQDFMDQVQKNLRESIPLFFDGHNRCIVINLAQVTNISIEEVPK